MPRIQPPAASRRRKRVHALLALALALPSCAAPVKPCIPTGEVHTVTILSRGWHTEIGIDSSALAGPLSLFRRIFPGAKTIMFGYGKRTFMTAHADEFTEYLIGPFPGPAVIEVIGISTTPDIAYGPQNSVALAPAKAGEAGLSAYIWNDLLKDKSGAPVFVGNGAFPGSLFYAARSQYTLDHDCNNWASSALRAAGFPISSRGVIFSGQVIARATLAAGPQCTAARS